MSLLEQLVKEDYGYKEGSRWGHSEEHDSLVIDAEKLRWFWNSKGIHGNTFDYLTKVRGYSDDQAKDFLKAHKFSISVSVSEEENTPTPYEALVDYLWIEGKKNRDYWYRRCLTDETIDRYRLGYFDEWYSIPVYMNGEFRNFQLRRDIPEKKIRPWYRGVGPLIYNSAILKFVDRIFITEGPVDAILLNQLGYPAISHTGGANGWRDEWFIYFTSINNIVYIADNDKAGVAGAGMVAKSLGEGRVKILKFSDKPEKYDAMDFFRDGNTVEEFEQRLLETKYIFEGI